MKDNIAYQEVNEYASRFEKSTPAEILDHLGKQRDFIVKCLTDEEKTEMLEIREHFSKSKLEKSFLQL